MGKKRDRPEWRVKGKTGVNSTENRRNYERKA